MRGALCGVLLILAANPAARPQEPAGGTIAGTVLDPDGAPMASVTVVVATVNGPGRYATRTDDRGRYRVNGVVPGRYYVKAGGCAADADPLLNCPTDAPIYVYHPGTDSRDAATVVSVAAGTAQDMVNFTLSRVSVAAMRNEGARLRAQATALWEMRRHAPARRGTWSSVDEMHGYFEATFIATPGMGSGRMSGERMQPDPQQLLQLSTEEGGSGRGHDTWIVKQLDLIGVAKHRDPVVFSRTAHGVYAQADRRLTDFELQSLSTLRLGSNVVTRVENGQMLLVGAIRARSACLACHQGHREGDVLGALRYVLRRAPE